LKKLKELKSELDGLEKALDKKEEELKQLEQDAEAFMRQLRAD